MSNELMNAARYLDAMHDIQVDEDHPKLHRVIKKYVLELGSETLNRYWHNYLLETGEQTIESETEELEPSEPEESVVYYRGVPQVVTKEETAEKENKPKAQVMYRGAKVD